MSSSPLQRSLIYITALCAGLASGQYVYDEEEAKMFASLASVPYCDAEHQIEDWSCAPCKDSKTRLVPGSIQIIDGAAANATRIVVGKLAERRGCLLSFRGSDNWENWYQDMQAWDVHPKVFKNCEGCMVHEGFLYAWTDLRHLTMMALAQAGCVPHTADAEVILTGHSYGGALSQLAMFDLTNSGFEIPKAYSFEAPRVGNKAFSDAFLHRFTDTFPVFRITNYKDPVVHVPPTTFGYVHVQTEVHYNASGHYRICPKVEDTSCADKYWNIFPLLFTHGGDHCNTSLVPNGNICVPLNCESRSRVFV